MLSHAPAKNLKVRKAQLRLLDFHRKAGAAVQLAQITALIFYA